MKPIQETVKNTKAALIRLAEEAINDASSKGLTRTEIVLDDSKMCLFIVTKLTSVGYNAIAYQKSHIDDLYAVKISWSIFKE